MRFVKLRWHLLVAIVVSTFLALSVPVHSNPLNQLIYYTEQLPAYNFIAENNPLKGISIELLAEMLKLAGGDVSPSKFQVLPWSLAYRKALLGSKTVLFSTTLTQERQEQFKWLGLTTKTENVFIRFKNPNQQTFSEDTITEYQYILVRDDVSEEEFKHRYSIPSAHLNFRNTIQEAMSILEKGKAEMLFYKFHAVQYVLKRLGLNIEDYEVVFYVSSNNLYFALSKDIGDSTLRLLENALFEISETSKMDIINKYSMLSEV